MLAAPLLLALALAPADAPTPPPDAAVSEAGELQGDWEVVAHHHGAADRTAEFKGFRWVFAGASARLVSPAGGTLRPLNVRADAARRTSEADDPFAPDCPPQRGIYSRSGDALLWAMGVPGASGRPSSFDPAPGVIVWTLRRVKK
jgi:uncharacterized protein (TIGR03067 family)